MENHSRKVCSAPSGKINLRMKGLRANSGQILKGCVKDTATKLSIGSIPSNNENIIHCANYEKAFGRSSPRFKYTNSQESTRYDDFMTIQLETSSNTTNPSHSKKGFGPFIAKQKRQCNQINVVPGPGQYELSFNFQNNKIIKKSRKALTKKFYCKKTQKSTQQNSNTSPGPGTYNLRKQQQRKKLVGCVSSFKTQGKRFTYIQNNINPGPGQYNKEALSSKNKTAINKNNTDIIKQNEQKKRAQKIIDSICNKVRKQKNYVPGPGAYQLQEPVLSPFYQKIKFSNNFIQGNINRFGQHKNSWKKIQHQFIYELPSAFDQAKRIKMIEGPAFMSQSKRQIFKKPELKLGPNTTNCTNFLMQKQSFLFNIYDQWR